MTEGENSENSVSSGNTITIDPKIITAIKVSAVLIVVVLCAMMVLIPLANSYNALVDSDLQVNRAASNVKADLERRADLLPDLAASVQGSATFEYKTQYDTYVGVAQARGINEAAQLKSQIQNAPATQVAATGVPQEQQLTQLLGNFVKLQEAYPNLQLNTVQQFREFGAQVTATENQILVDRQTYNSAVTQYQRVCRSFPTVLVANYYGFSDSKYQMYIPVNQTRAEEVPTITFDFSKL